MAVEARIRELSARHAELDTVIGDEVRHPATDPLHIAQMKREKLRLKDEIERLTRSSSHL